MSSVSTLNCRGATLPRLAVVLLVFFGLILLHDSWLPDSIHSSRTRQPPSFTTQSSTDRGHGVYQETTASNNSDSVPAPSPSSAACRSAPGADNILVLLKTGATEIYEKLPTHLVTLLECTPHFAIYSDLQQNFAQFPIHDAIAPVSKHIRQKHEDFELYRKLQQYQQEGQDLSELKGGNGWNLDKWKFLPLLHEAFEKAEDNIEWFFLMEADTSVSWTNLLQWTRILDPSEAYYLGAQNSLGDTVFAHGGSGVLISRKAADMLSEKRSKDPQTYDLDWEDKTAQSCCGDGIIADAFKDAGVAMTPAWPLTQGERVQSIDWTKNHWCSPAITWHHVSPIEVDAMWQFQTQWVDKHGWDEPYLYRDVFSHFIDRHVSVNRTAWNNLSKKKKLVSPQLAKNDDLDFDDLEEYEQHAVESEEKCAEACQLESEFDCVQWMYSPGRCYLDEDVRFGKSDERKEEHWVSGWDQDRIAAFKDHQEPCQVQWKG